MTKLYLAAFFLFICLLSADAQTFYSFRSDRNVIATVGLNTSTYYGDLKADSDVLDAKPSLSLGLMTGVSRRLYLRGEFSWITLSGRDLPDAGSGRAGRNLSFTSNNYEFNISGLLHIAPRKRRFYQRSNFNAYGILGIGGLYFNPMATLDGQQYALQPLQTEGVEYSRFALVVPFGIGAKVKLTPFMDLAIEAGWRKTFTDYLDDVSTVHIDNASITNPITKRLTDRRPEVGLPVRPAGSIRGNPDADDAYMLLSAKIEYYLPYQFSKQNRRVYQRKRRATYR